jgi:hypothetical protein
MPFLSAHPGKHPISAFRRARSACHVQIFQRKHGSYPLINKGLDGLCAGSIVCASGEIDMFLFGNRDPLMRERGRLPCSEGCERLMRLRGRASRCSPGSRTSTAAPTSCATRRPALKVGLRTSRKDAGASGRMKVQGRAGTQEVLVTTESRPRSELRTTSRQCRGRIRP